MPASITALPPELIGKVFRSLGRLCEATRLAQTCPLMYAVWRDNRSSLCKTLVWNSPLFWRYGTYNDYIKFWEGVTLVESAKQLERLRQDYDEHEDGFVAARRIRATAFQVRAAAKQIDWQINEYWEGQCPFEYKSPEDLAWQRLAELAIGRMLYRLLIHFDRGVNINYRGRISLLVNGEVVSDQGLWQLAKFVAFHWEPHWEFPNVGPLVGNPERCDCVEDPNMDMRFCDHNGWSSLVDVVEDEYEELVESSEYEELVESSESSGSDWQSDSDSES
ncbi:hypothetical protein K440DRAFT_661456 [Wilcoxina mikolae CBS 423.85]|nr:hypothetical protein K440DRAFT_661456 [Wilcoxina mikolae CBS 423.85]